eukprot:TRINITY_DN2108_c0_g1_i2.p1 TRINITY_DN2108_c0_g1~~TRINITY_DN2108_c0_g1_i2.p1  ORF type:complete len:861 (+),score=179.37 TRINITY_DN2108_c0_g1_i2:250-2832(+)
MVLRFKGDTYIEQIQFLSHASKIASKIEVFVSEPTQQSSHNRSYYQLDEATWKRLGYLSLSPNEESDYMARELKTVHVNCDALYLRLLLHKCHINAYNYYNQVGLVAINILGSMGPTYKQSPTPYTLETGVMAPDSGEGIPLNEMKPPEGIESQDVRYDMQFDPVTLKKIRELTTVKQNAVQEEDYDLAKKMKEQIDSLKLVGNNLLMLENQKSQAVAVEDYDLAKALKQEIDNLRSRAALVGGKSQNAAPPPPPVCLPPMSGQPQASIPQQQPPLQQPALPPLQSSQPPPDPEPEQRTTFSIRKVEVEYDEQVVVGSASYNPPPPQISNNGNSIDEKPAVSRVYSSNRIQPEGSDEENDIGSSKKWWDIEKVMATEDPFNSAKQPSAPPSTKKAASKLDSLSEWEKDLVSRITALQPEAATPEEIPDAKLRAHPDFVNTFGHHTTCCMLAKKWQFRDASIRSIAGKIAASSNGTDAHPFPVDVSQVTILFLKYISLKSYGLNDSISSVIPGIMDALRALIVAKPHHSVTPTLNHVAMCLVAKAGDGNQRTRELSTEMIMMLAASPVFGIERVASCIFSESTDKKKASPSHWRPILAKVSTLSLLLDKFGLDKHSLPPDVIMSKVALPAMENANGDVREAGVKLVSKLCHLGAGKTVARYTADLKPALKAVIDKECQDGPHHHNKPHEREMMNTSMSIDGNDQAKQQIRQAREALSPPREPQPDPAVEEEIEDDCCQFCRWQDPDGDKSKDHGQALDQHYLRSCPMLHPCKLCGQVIEIMLLNDHWLMECSNRKQMKQCPRCLFALNESEFEAHVAAKDCIPHSEEFNICVLCYEKIPPGVEGWDEHLLKGCAKNPRKVT